MANIVHRKTRKLPSVRKHGLSAILLIGIIGLSLIAYANFTHSPLNPESPSGQEVTLDIPPKALPPNDENLPDLLKDDNIPLDVNPTDPVEMIGAPQMDPKQLQTNPKAPDTLPTGTAPKTILIDGKPMGQNYATTNTSAPLTRAPIRGLTRMSPFGAMPTIATDGRTVLQSYAKPFTPKPGIKYASIIVGGLGVDQALTLRAINELPGEVSLSFAANTLKLQSWIDRARAQGHEVLIELPMESDGFDSTAIDSALTLTVNGPDSQNIRNLDDLLSRAQGYFAVTNYGGEVLVKNEKSLKPIIEHLQHAGLGFVYDGAEKGARIQPLGRKYSLPVISANSFLDTSARDRRSVSSAITSLANNTNHTVPIGMGFSYNGTIDGVLDWLKSKPTRTALAPVSYALKTSS